MWRLLWPSRRLRAGQVRIVESDRTDVLVYRTRAGQLHAIEAWCPHMRNYMPNGLPPGRPLTDLLHGNDIECPFHGWRFSGQGECTGVPPGQRGPAAAADGRPIIRCWAVREKDGLIQLGPATQPCGRTPEKK